MFLKSEQQEIIKALPLLLTLWGIGIALLCYTNLPLKKVELQTSTLFVSNYLKTIQIPLAYVARAEKIVGRGNLPRYRIKLVLNTPTELGSDFTFVPRFEFDLPNFLEKVAASKQAFS